MREDSPKIDDWFVYNRQLRRAGVSLGWEEYDRNFYYAHGYRDGPPPDCLLMKYNGVLTRVIKMDEFGL